jgi:hypothetical protein
MIINLLSTIYNFYNNKILFKIDEKSKYDKFDLVKNKDFHLLFIGTCSS